MRSVPVLLALAFLAAACGDNLQVGADSLAVTPSSVTVAVGDSVTVAAAYTIDGESIPADDVTWTSSNVATATVADNGASASITGIAEGSATITASGRSLNATVNVAVTAGNVTLVSIEVTPTAPTLANGTTVQLIATGTYSDSSTANVTTMATWSSNDNAIATVGTDGLVTGQDPGDATITATVGTVSGSTTVTVTDALLLSIEVTPTDPSMAAGFDLPFTATGTFSDTTIQDLTTQVTWTSSDESVATISNTTPTEGYASTLVPGTTTITATLGAISAATQLEVTDAVLVLIEVTPPDPTVPLGVDPQFTATGTFSDTSTQDLTTMVTWTSSDESVATISAAGLAETLSAGTTAITATLGAIADASDLTVTDATLVSIAVTPVNPSVPLGVDQQFTATGTYTDATTQNITDQVLWASSDDTVATISNAAGSEGFATSLAAGTTTISATQGAISGTTDLTVTSVVLVSIEVTPTDPTVALGVDVSFTATGTYSDSSTADITTQVVWASSFETVATISNAAGSEGLATSVGLGDTTISASQGTVTGTTNLTVTNATLVSIEIIPDDPSVPLGIDQQFTAMGTYSDASVDNITMLVTWGSTDDTVASISNAAGSEGFAETLAAGTTTISATLGAVSDTSTLTVTSATLVSIAVTPTTATRGIGQTEQFTATGTFSDTTLQDITTTVTWQSSMEPVAQISNAAGSEGLATAIAAGSTGITATSGVIVSNTATLTVVAPPAVVATNPADGAANVPGNTAIEVTFSEAMNPATLSGQITNGACTATIQLSANNFTSCLAFAAAAPTMSAGDTIATLQPAATLGTGAVYKIRVLGTVESAGAVPMGTTYVQANGFTTATGACSTGLVISQVYGGGGNTGAQYTNDFIELHNAGTSPIDVNGMAVQYASSAGATWQVTPLAVAPTIIAPGGYFLVQEAAGAGMPAPLPTPDAIGLIPMGGTAGKVALTSTIVPLAAACPTGGTIIDFVGYGTAANCFEGTGPTGAPSNTTAAIRNAGGCPDGDNSLNFSVLAPTPRNSASAPYVCACSINETGLANELDYCNLQFPPTIAVPTGMPTALIYGRAFEGGVTDPPGADPTLLAQIGFGPSGSNPITATTSWTWGTATFNVQLGNDDEYQLSLTAPAPGSYGYTSRFSRDGVNWTYCDLDGAGSNAALAFDAGQLGAMTVTP